MGTPFGGTWANVMTPVPLSHRLVSEDTFTPNGVLWTDVQTPVPLMSGVTADDATASEIYETLLSDMGQTFAKILDALEVGADWRVDYEHAKLLVGQHRQAWLSFQTRTVVLSAEVQQKVDNLDAAVFLLEKRHQ